MENLAEFSRDAKGCVTYEQLQFCMKTAEDIPKVLLQAIVHSLFLAETFQPEERKAVLLVCWAALKKANCPHLVLSEEPRVSSGEESRALERLAAAVKRRQR